MKFRDIFDWLRFGLDQHDRAAERQRERDMDEVIGPVGDEPEDPMADLDIAKWFDHPEGPA